ncbi:MAG: c-type cytochrome [Gemmatimonadaceae bacterium]
MTTTHGFATVLPMMALLGASACTGSTSGRKDASAGSATHAAATSTPAAPTAPPAVRHDEHIFAGGIAPPGDTLHNPFAGDAKAAAAGAQLFTSMNCDGCHGGGATGWVGPSLSDGRWRYGGADGEIFQSIYYGRPHGMPAFGGALPQEFIWRIVTYLNTLPVPKDVPTESW